MCLLTYFHLVNSHEFSDVASERKWTHKLFYQVPELMVTEDHEFVQNSTSPRFAFLTYPFHMGIPLPFGKVSYKGVLGHLSTRRAQVFIVRKRYICVHFRINVNIQTQCSQVQKP